MTTITRAGAEAIDRVGPLWIELHHHHQAVGGEALGPYVDDATSWRERRAMYERFFGDGGFALLAERDGELLGYAMVAIAPAADSILADTWATGARIAEIESLYVSPSERGGGIGNALLDRIDEELAAEGISDVLIGAVVANSDAIRLYERRGFRPAWLYMFRLGGRPA